MAVNLSRARLGIFVFLGAALLVIAIFLIGNKESIFESTFTIKTYFNTVEGLRSGAPVRLSGIDVGSVADIEIANDTTGRVIVTMSIGSDVKQFVRKDTRASIETEGLVGNKIVVLSVGSVSYPVVQNNGWIPSKNPMNIAQIIEESQGTLSYLRNIAKDFADISARINRGEGTIGKLINDDELYNAATQITRSADKSLNTITLNLEDISGIVKDATGKFQNIVVSVDTAIKKIDLVLADVRNGRGILGALVSDNSPYSDSMKTLLNNVIATTQEVKVGAARFAENMEALKHNWLFKSYFEERGYWDISEYEKNIDSKLSELKERTRALDERIKELRELENRSGGR